MNIDDDTLKELATLVTVGLIWTEGTSRYTDIVNNTQVRRFIVQNDMATEHFKFLDYVLNNQKVTKCPKCGHFNTNIECPVIVCDYCGDEFIIHGPEAVAVCKDCIAYKTRKCEKSKLVGETHGNEQARKIRQASNKVVGSTKGRGQAKGSNHQRNRSKTN
jgi:hypothetical protein